jgi:hypothetical protein
MGKLTKIHVSYEIKDPPMIVEPNDELEGKIVVTNNGEKDQKFKELFIDLVEVYDEDTGEGLDPRKTKLQTYFYNTKGVIKAGETQEYKFKIALSKWRRKKGKRIYNWNIQLQFKQKTKMVATRGSIKRNATCILPVFGTMVSPSFGNAEKPKKRKK